jgi:hypothetical protein
VTGLKGGEKNLFGEEAVENIENPAAYARTLAAYLQLKIEQFKSSGKPLALVSGDYTTTLKGILDRNQYSTMDRAWYGNKKCKSGPRRAHRARRRSANSSKSVPTRNAPLTTTLRRAGLPRRKPRLRQNARRSVRPKSASELKTRLR